ncbi:hypothetical protein SAY87_026295 [Trapa incisa]|uniref:SCD domain-containing protein n=1 Tax=Trapa incisa TaxID=236973 RepID=A0AAN7GUQ4_9MYRT|nr:hypothetical protein SAY87_026295 [Trapa incisa]
MEETDNSAPLFKRPRDQTLAAEGGGGADQHGRTSNATDRSPERQGSPDYFQELRPQAKRSRTAEASARLVEPSLIDVIKGNGKLITQTVKLWVERYETDSKSAMVELLTMLFAACGAKYYIKEENLDETDVDDVVVALVSLAKQGEVEDYQSSKKREFKNFKDNLLAFWDNLVIESQNGPLFDQVLFDKCMDYIIALSCTPPRVYRQVASLMGLQLVTSFIAVAKALGSQRETTQRQLNAEKKKTTDGPRLESLNKRLTSTHEKITVMEEMMRKIFTGLFVHRYRDIDPSIRMSCIESLGVWISSYTSLFLQDLYLKYLGWTLNDKDAGVRKASVIALQNLYELDDNVPSLGLFTERFSNRMIELADDIDISVAVCAIGLVKQLLRHQLLPDDDLGPLYDLLIDDPPDIRHAIGGLVYDHLIAQKFNSTGGSKGSDSRNSEVHLGRMLQILREFSADPVLSMYVIDDVWEYMNAMKDWKCIISMLLDENPRVDLTDEDATNLARLLCASIKKAVGERIVPASDNRKPYYNKAQKEIFENNRKDITVAMMKNYPQLLCKYVADKAKIPFLSEVIVYINLELFSLKRQEQSFKSMLKMLKEAFFKHREKDALRSCVNAIKFCSVESRGELQDFARNQVKELEDDLIEKIKSSIKLEDSDDEYSLLVNLKRLYELQLSRNVPIGSLYEDFSRVVQTFGDIDTEIVNFLLLNMYLHVTWSLHNIASSETVSADSVSTLLSRRNVLFERLESFLNESSIAQVRKHNNQLARRVCTILAESWILFRMRTFSSTNLERLGYSPDASVCQKFWKLCETQLYISDETEEDGNKEYIEETNRDAVMIAAAKLVALEAIPKEYLASDIISHYVMHGASVAENVKHLIKVLRKKDDDLSDILLGALEKAHLRYMAEVLRDDDQSLVRKLFQDCKDLSTRLSAMFTGGARNKHRLEILKIVRDGIDYAFSDAPKQLSFLECSVLHFVSKLPHVDILDILKNVQRRTGNVNTDENPSGWRPYNTFVDTLHEKCLKIEGLPGEKEGVSARRRGRPRKRRNIEGKRLFDGHGLSEEDDAISSSDHDDAQDEDRQEDNEEDEAPLIHSIRASSKLRSLRVSKDENRSHSRMGETGKSWDNPTV